MTVIHPEVRAIYHLMLRDNILIDNPNDTDVLILCVDKQVVMEIINCVHEICSSSTKQRHAIAKSIVSRLGK